MAKGKMQWITIASDQAILMSVCLQAMVDELLMKKTGSRKKQVTIHFILFTITQYDLNKYSFIFPSFKQIFCLLQGI